MNWLSRLPRTQALAFLRDPGRWRTAASAVVMGTIALILADGFIARIYQDFGEDIIRSHFGHVQLLPRANGDGRPVDEARLDATLVPRVEAMFEAGGPLADLAPGQPVTVAPRLSVTGLIARGDRTIGFIGEGVDPAKERSLSRAMGIVSGRALADARAAEVVLGEGLARSLGAKPGDRLTLLANTRHGGVNGVEVEVVGLFYTATKAYDDRALRLPLAVAQSLLRASDISKVMVLLPSTDTAAQATQRLREALRSQPLDVKSWRELADFYNKTVELFDKQLGVIRLIVILIVMLSISNAMARNVLERTREIGTMLALGDRRRTVLRQFLQEGVIIALVGAALGAVLGALLGLLVSAVGIPMPPPPGMARGFMGGIALSWGGAALACGLTACATLLAAIVPAVRASRVPIVDALRTGR